MGGEYVIAVVRCHGSGSSLCVPSCRDTDRKSFYNSFHTLKVNFGFFFHPLHSRKGSLGGFCHRLTTIVRQVDDKEIDWYEANESPIRYIREIIRIALPGLDLR